MARKKTEKNVNKISPSAEEATVALSNQMAEVWAFILFFLGVFVFISNHYPESTGFVGYWFVEYFSKNLVGQGILYLPVFFWASSISLFLATHKNAKQVLIGLATCFSAFVVYLEFKINGPPLSVSFPIPTNGGGLIGLVGSYVLFKTVGIYGSLVLLASAGMISLVLVFNLSLRSVFRGIGSAFRWMYSAVETRYQAQNGTTKASVPASTWKERWARLKDVLFYTRVQEIEFKGSDVRSLQAIDKPKIEVKSFEDRLSEMEVDDDDDSDDTEDDDTEEDVFAESRSVEIPGANDDAIVPTTDTVFSNSDHDDELAGYELPSLSLLQTVKGNATKKKQRLKSAQDKAAVLEMALSSFNVEAKVVNITAGPSVTRYELKPGDGVKISKITNLAQDIALKLEAADIRIEAPIPGKALVGIEVANPSVEMVTMRSIIDETDFMKDPAKLPVTVGLTITGEPIVMKLEEMPHLLIAGATGSGKSVCVNSIIMSILLRARPDEVKFLMIDPKKVELSLYNDIPHLLAPVVTNSNKAAATLKQWPLQEMERRYETFSQMGVKHISQYNAESEIKLPYIVVIIDELADLMMVASQDVEHTICRLAQMARATGIHLVVATQRPSVNVVTGLIKANIPSRISFFVQSQIDSRTILDMGGAEKLLGKGDMLYAPVGQSHKPLRVQGVYVDEKEVKSVVDWVKAQAKPTYVHEIIDVQPILPDIEPAAEEKTDALFDQAKEIIQGTQYASTSYLQRKLRIGYNRAARLMDELEEKEVVSPMTEGKRTVL